MKNFMDCDFLLSNETAKVLYHDYAEDLPIIDYHCHIVPKEIEDDITFDNITQVWLGADHYKWRQMRSNGVEEKYITGDATDREKFQAWAETLEKAIGNPLYHWSHLELQRYFGYYGVLNSDTAEEVWNICNEKLRNGMSAKKFIMDSKVTTLCTTDDPCDSLEHHKNIAKDKAFTCKVLPAFRPDDAINIEKTTFLAYMKRLEAASNVEIHDFSSLCKALSNRMEYFATCGCKVADHGLDYVMYVPATLEEVNQIFLKKLEQKELSSEEILKFKTALLLHCGKEYHRLGFVMQLHYGVLRDNNTRVYRQIGINTGFDCINTYTSSEQLTAFLDALAISDELPRTILYSLNPTDNAAIDTIIGCFQDSSCAGKIQHGAAWWFNDHKTGMMDQMTSLANSSLLSNFIGMLTDSRSFLSYTRHEYFRRILCNFLGTLVENGEYPKDIKRLGKMVSDISYYNSAKYFGFDE